MRPCLEEIFIRGVRTFFMVTDTPCRLCGLVPSFALLLKCLGEPAPWQSVRPFVTGGNWEDSVGQAAPGVLVTCDPIRVTVKEFKRWDPKAGKRMGKSYFCVFSGLQGGAGRWRRP